MVSSRVMPRTFHRNFYREFRRRVCPPWAAVVITAAIAGKLGV